MWFFRACSQHGLRTHIIGHYWTTQLVGLDLMGMRHDPKLIFLHLEVGLSVLFALSGVPQASTGQWLNSWLCRGSRKGLPYRL